MQRDIILLVIKVCHTDTGAVLAPPSFGGCSGGWSLEKFVGHIMYKYAVSDTENQHIITTFSSQIPKYTKL